jgi:hypothetical protein
MEQTLLNVVLAFNTPLVQVGEVIATLLVIGVGVLLMNGVGAGAADDSTEAHEDVSS